MVYPHNKEDDKAQTGRRRQKKKRYSKNKPKQQTRKSVEFPDPLAKYFKMKYPDKWKAFTEFATSHKKFGAGLARLLEILMQGDEEDQKILGLVPIYLLNEFDIKIDLVGCNNGEDATLGDQKHKTWREIEREIHFSTDSMLTNIDPPPNPDDYDDPEEKARVTALRDHINNHPVVKKAMDLFGGKIVGYNPPYSDNG